MKTSSIILAATLASIFGFVGGSVVAAPKSTATQLDGSTPLTAQEQDEMIQEALSLINAESANANDGSAAENEDAEDGDDHGHGHGKGKGHHKKHFVRGGSNSGIAKGDFNGDGFADLAIGVPEKDTPSTVANSGAVIVIYGSVNGLVAPPNLSLIPKIQFWSQNSPGVPGASEAGDHFGSALASGDFNGDGFSDLAIGAPDEIGVVSGLGAEGAVTIIYGSSRGLNTDAATRVLPAQQWLLPNLHGLDGLVFFAAIVETDVPRNISHFGAALAWGDFNGDGFGDLAIGAPAAKFDFGIFGEPRAGAVGILFGGPNGLTATGSQFIHRPFELISETPVEDGNNFGAALAAGDFQHDGFSDLAVGVPNQNFVLFPGSPFAIRHNNAGVVEVFNGSSGGVHSAPDRTLLECCACDLPQQGAQFGSSLATGDFDGDGRSDLAAGAPFEDVGATPAAGAVLVFSGNVSCSNPAGPDTNQVLTQTAIFGPSPGFLSETGDEFGFSLAAGDFNGDGHADLAIGVPFEDYVPRGLPTPPSVQDAGEVDIIYGAANGLSATNHAQFFREEDLGLTPQKGDNFGYSLSAWNFGRDEHATKGIPPQVITFKTADLAIGIPFKKVGTANEAGAVSVIYGSFFHLGLGGLGATTDQIWTENSAGMPTSAVVGDHFGLSLY